jgi:hypothetical protein
MARLPEKKTAAKTAKKAAKKSAAKKTARSAGLKTKATSLSPVSYIASLPDGPRKTDAQKLLALFEQITGWKAQMWGPSIIGFGRYRYVYESGRSGEMCVTGFSPRAANLVIYILPGYQDIAEPLSRLGKHKIGKSCLYIKTLADIDVKVLAEIIRFGLAHMKKKYAVADR